MTRRPAAAALAPLGVLAALGLSACSTGPAPVADPGPAPSPVLAAPAGSPTASADVPTTPAPAVDEACGAFDDAALRARLADAPLVEALSADSRLAGFHDLVTGRTDPKVDLTGVLASGTSTLLAPVDAELSGSAATLRYLLSFHVVPGAALTPEQLVAPPPDAYGHETLQDEQLPAFGEPDAPLLSEDSVPVLCGPVATAEGALYVVGAPLRPAGDYVVPGDPELPPPVTEAPDR